MFTHRKSKGHYGLNIQLVHKYRDGAQSHGHQTNKHLHQLHKHTQTLQ